MAYVYRRTLKVYESFSGEQYYKRKLHDDAWSSPKLDIDKLDELLSVFASGVKYAISQEKTEDVAGYQTRLGDNPHFYLEGKHPFGRPQGRHNDEDLLTRFLWENTSGDITEQAMFEFMADNYDGPEGSWVPNVEESPLLLGDVKDYEEIYPCSCRLEVAEIDDALVKWYSPERIGATDSEAEGYIKVMLKNSVAVSGPIPVPYFSSPLDKTFRPFCLEPDSLEFQPVSAQVGNVGIQNYEEDDYDDVDFEEDEE